MKFYIGLRSFKYQCEHIETCHYPEFVQKQTTNSEEKHANLQENDVEAVKPQSSP